MDVSVYEGAKASLAVLSGCSDALQIQSQIQLRSLLP